MAKRSNNKKLLVKIIDFGLAKAIHTQTDPKSLTHDRFVGTPAFASPEQFEHSALDVRSDIYSLGETLWFALTGKTPFAGRAWIGDSPRPKIKCASRRTTQSSACPLSPEVAAWIDARIRTGLAARHQRVSSAPATLLPGGTQRATHARRSRSRSPRDSRHVCTFRLSTDRESENAALNPAPDKSIAVLPFENLSEEKANAFFAEGVQDEILTDLAKIADLKVISRTSVLQYKSGVARNLREIAQQLGVANVVEGSVQRSGNRVRVNAQLVDARTDAHLWAQTYDRDLADVFAIQSEIAKAIADQLQAKLSPNEKKAIEQPPTTDLAAFDLYSHAKSLASHGIFERDERARPAEGN